MIPHVERTHKIKEDAASIYLDLLCERSEELDFRSDVYQMTDVGNLCEKTKLVHHQFNVWFIVNSLNFHNIPLKLALFLWTLCIIKYKGIF